MRQQVASALLLPVALLLGFACADEDIDYDANKPIISEASLTKLFGMIDKDLDGRATVAELKSFSQEMIRFGGGVMQKDVMAQLDENEDGRLTFAEVLPRPDLDTPEAEESYKWERTKFKAADKDNDSFLDMDELARFLHPSTDPQVEEVFAASELQRKDADGDGKLDLPEFVGVASAQNPPGLITEEDRRHFGKLDADGDGKLTAKEFGPFESGRQHIEESMQWIVAHADADGDGHVALGELLDAREKLEAHDLSIHMDEWAHLLEL